MQADLAAGNQPVISSVSQMALATALMP
jgi:hypothetical protein